MDKEFKQTFFFKENKKMENKHMKRCSTTLVIREMQIKAAMSYHFTSTIIAITKKTDDNNTCW